MKQDIHALAQRLKRVPAGAVLPSSLSFRPTGIVPLLRSTMPIFLFHPFHPPSQYKTDLISHEKARNPSKKLPFSARPPGKVAPL